MKVKTNLLCMTAAFALAMPACAAGPAQPRSPKSATKLLARQKEAGLASITENAPVPTSISLLTTFLRVGVPVSVVRASPSSISSRVFVRLASSRFSARAMSSPSRLMPTRS